MLGTISGGACLAFWLIDEPDLYVVTGGSDRKTGKLTEFGECVDLPQGVIGLFHTVNLYTVTVLVKEI